MPGKWRLPTCKDLDDLLAKGKVTWSGSNWSEIGSTPAGSNANGNNAHGFYQPVSGMFLGKGATAGDNKRCPAEGIVTFPTSGRRNGGSAQLVGNYGWFWTGSSGDSSKAYYVDLYNGHVLGITTPVLTVIKSAV